jgi:hypothetical protein
VTILQTLVGAVCQLRGQEQGNNRALRGQTPFNKMRTDELSQCGSEGRMKLVIHKDNHEEAADHILSPRAHKDGVCDCLRKILLFPQSLSNIDFGSGLIPCSCYH